MGQYYEPINIDKMEYLVSHDFDNGLKLMEHSYIGNNFMEVVERLLSPNGAWHRCHLVWAGDYMDDGLFLPEGTTLVADGKEFKPNLFGYVDEKGKNLTGFSNPDYNEDYNIRRAKAEKAAKKFSEKLPKAGKILVNWTRGVCLDLDKENPFEVVDGEFYTIHPLSLLTCSGNGRGGGDYRGGDENVGTWAGEEISMEYEVPEGIELIEPMSFQE